MTPMGGLYEAHLTSWFAPVIMTMATRGRYFTIQADVSCVFGPHIQSDISLHTLSKWTHYHFFLICINNVCFFYVQPLTQNYNKTSFEREQQIIFKKQALFFMHLSREDTKSALIQTLIYNLQGGRRR